MLQSKALRQTLYIYVRMSAAKTTDFRRRNRLAEMEDPRRSTLSFTFILCFSLWLTSGEAFNFWEQCIDECPARYFSATYKVQCSDRCDKRGYDYYWCNTNHGWDYCSPGENIDFQGFRCRDQYPCGNYGENYNQCLLVGGSLDKCGRVEPRAMIHYTLNLKECTDSCQYSESGDYFWCYTADSWDYCSPLPHHTYKNEPCRENHECGRYGYDYNWCYTTYNNDWDYCGIISPGECEYSQTHRSKRQPGNSRLICTREDGDNNNRRVTIFREEGDSRNIAQTNNRLRNEALDLINQWDNQRLTDQSRSNLISSSHLRLDNQGLCNRNNQRCYNLQIQINQQRSRGESTTVAHILVPVDTSAEYMRQAFRESLQRQATVVLEVTDGASTSSNNQKCCRRRKN